MEFILTGFLLGLAGSFHCVGMCGPIALSLPLRGNSFVQKLLGALVYNLGRTCMYGIMGIVFGMIGQGLQLLGFQRWISIAMGVLLILSIFTPYLFAKINVIQLNHFTAFVRKSIQKLFSIQSLGGLFLIGLLNSLLPCGLVYIAIAGAIALGDIYTGIIYLVAFGLGTIPLMLVVSMIGNAITVKVRNIINSIIPYIVVAMGVLFILRGLCLGIPFISPKEENLKQTIFQSMHSSRDVKQDESCCHTN